MLNVSAPAPDSMLTDWDRAEAALKSVTEGRVVNVSEIG